MQDLQTEFQFQQEIIQTYSQSWNFEIRQKFSFLDQCDQLNMRNRKKVIRHACIICFIREISEIDNRVCNNIRSNHFIETFDFSIFCTRNYIKIDEKIINLSTLHADIQFQKNVSSTQTQTTCEKICHQFTFFVRCNQVCMRIDETINNQHIVFCFVCNIVETNVWIFYIFRIDRFIQEFVFHEFYIWNNMSIQRKIDCRIISIRESWYI